MAKAQTLAQKDKKTQNMGVKDGLIAKKKNQKFKNTPTGKVPLIPATKKQQNGSNANGASKPGAKGKNKQLPNKNQQKVKAEELKKEKDVDSEDGNDSNEELNNQSVIDKAPKKKGVKMFKGLKTGQENSEDDVDEEADDDDDSEDDDSESANFENSETRGIDDDSDDDSEDDEDDEDEDEGDDEDDEDSESVDLENSETKGIEDDSDDDSEDDDDDEDDEDDDDDEEDDDEDEDENTSISLKALLGDSIADDDDDEDFNEDEDSDDDDEDDDISDDEEVTLNDSKESLDDDDDNDSDESDDNDDADENIEESKPSKKTKKQQESPKRVPLSPKEKELIDAKTIFVGNVPKDVELKTLKKLFRPCGEIQNLRFRGVVPEDTRMSPKVATITKKMHPKVKSIYAYVTFKDEDSAKKAVKLNGVKLQDHVLTIDFSKSAQKDCKKAVFLGNLAFDITEDEVRTHFVTCGKIESVHIIKDRRTGLGKGFGYVNFETEDSVTLALELNDTKLKNRELRVAICSPTSKDKKRKQHTKKDQGQRNQKKFKNVQGKAVTVKGDAQKGQKKQRSQGKAKRDKSSESENQSPSPVKKEKKTSFQGQKADGKKKSKQNKMDKKKKIMAAKLTSAKKSAKTTD